MHIAIILDGNGRWATRQGLPRLAGHKQGIETFREIVRICPELSINTLTVYAFAIANWKRNQEEVDGLWELFRTFFEHDVAELLENDVRVRVIGRRDGLPEDVLKLIEDVEARSKDNQAALVQIALNYDGIDEVARLLQKAIAEGVTPEEVDSEYILNHLDTESGNEPDIVIRTGMPSPEGELAVWRGSSFLPLQSTQSVCVSTTTLWPAFTKEHLEAIIQFADPDARLFGGQRT